ncbi:hypothetical protein BWQ96_01224 [Gracilariopsis chorda]|uniref:Uncharacterized protein n=1 Tax=Gracilariopsis chorda TaxID=448386 RepID=A0A2V3J3Q1_9FLOR|nr:hypothetical protein BWQ96_01224 [Gracilariopsis chorda]|eukprot:PXF49086.1 hypothetical protein BWQ96_01224 [Gracilariopsis chorda]
MSWSEQFLRKKGARPGRNTQQHISPLAFQSFPQETFSFELRNDVRIASLALIIDNAKYMYYDQNSYWCNIQEESAISSSCRNFDIFTSNSPLQSSIRSLEGYVTGPNCIKCLKITLLHALITNRQHS